MKIRRIASIAILAALSVGLHYLESLIPTFLPIPGFRLGLANLVLLFVLYYYDGISYVFANLVKIILVCAFGQGFGINFLMSLTGSLCAMSISLFLYYVVKPSIFALSASGAFFHTLGQVAFYSIFVQNFYMFTYFALLGPLSILTGLLMALLNYFLLLRIPQRFKWEEKFHRR